MPIANRTTPARNGQPGPIRSQIRPATTVASSIPIRNSENAQA